jgi:hypothetical protein
MMIIGVAGSTALVVGAFGMLDSISDVTSTQYNEIILYNTLVEVNDYTIDPFEDFPNVEKQDIIYRLQGEAADNDEYELEIIAPFEDTNLNEYINFIKDGNKVEFNEDSMFISSQLSEVLGIGVDDVFFFNVNNKQYSVLVNGVVEKVDTVYYNFQQDLFMYQIYRPQTQSYSYRYGYDIMEGEKTVHIELINDPGALSSFLPLTDWSSAKRTFTIDKVSNKQLIMNSEGKTYTFRKF